MITLRSPELRLGNAVILRDVDLTLNMIRR